MLPSNSRLVSNDLWLVEDPTPRLVKLDQDLPWNRSTNLATDVFSVCHRNVYAHRHGNVQQWLFSGTEPKWTPGWLQYGPDVPSATVMFGKDSMFLITNIGILINYAGGSGKVIRV
jgi:hypothetical protein